MSKFDLTMLPPWEQLFKRVLWAQLGDLRGKRILDFGSGVGVTACLLPRQWSYTYWLDMWSGVQSG